MDFPLQGRHSCIEKDTKQNKIEDLDPYSPMRRRADNVQLHSGHPYEVLEPDAINAFRKKARTS